MPAPSPFKGEIEAAYLERCQIEVEPVEGAETARKSCRERWESRTSGEGTPPGGPSGPRQFPRTRKTPDPNPPGVPIAEAGSPLAGDDDVELGAGEVLLRTGPVKSGPSAQVDREAGVIRGVSVIELGPAIGHDFDIDETTIDQVIELGNRNPLGTKVRLSHPDACNDGTGRELGRNRNHRRSDDGQRVLADLHTLDAASRSPDGDLTGWLMDVAEEDPAMVGLSIHAKAKATPRLDDAGDPLVIDGVKARPVLRIQKLIGTDVVDSPAANRAGLFASAAQWGSDLLDEVLTFDHVGRELDEDHLAALFSGNACLLALANGLTGPDDIRLDSTSTPADLDRVAGFLNRHLDRREIGHPALDAEAIRRIVHRLQEPQIMPNPQPPTTAPATVPAAATPPELNPEPAATLTAPNEQALQAAILAENERVRGIQAVTLMFPDAREALAEKEKDAIANVLFSIDDWRTTVLKELAKGHAPPSATSINVGESANEKLRAQASDAILLANNIRLEGEDIDGRRRTAQASGLMALGPQQIARICLSQVGVRGVDRMSADDLFNAAMGGYALTSGVGHTTADFPLILADSASKSMVAGYNMTPVTWDQWCKIGNLKDFKPTSRLRLSESPLLEVRNEGEPARQGTFNEQREQITLTPYAKGVSYTRQMFINDDLGAFADLSSKMGAGANYTVEVEVYANLTLNTRTGPTMSDATVLFTAGHANLSATGTVPTQATLENIINAMMTQRGIGQDGASVTIGVAPSIWFAAPNVATAIEKIINSPFAGSDARRDPQVQELVNSKVLKVAQLVAAGATTDYYAVAPQNLAPSYEVGFLNGQRMPRTSIVNHPTVDGTTIIVASDFAVFPTGGWQGIHRHPGA